MIDWQCIDTVLLDMDGTLLDLHFDNYFWLVHLPERYAEEHGVSLQEAKDYLGAQIRNREGTLQWYCLDHWSELVKLDIPSLKREIQHKIKARPYAEQFLENLKNQGKRLILITNCHPDGINIKFEVTNIDQWLDIVISSHEFSSPKEDQLFWQKLAQREHFDPQRTVFIDDTPRILRSAQTFGIQHLVCVTAPDSQKPVHLSEEFFGIQHFNEIMPTPEK